MEEDGVQEALGELELAAAFLFEDAVVRLSGVGAATDEFGDDREDVGGGAAVAETAGVGQDAEVQGLGGDGVDGEALGERTGGEDVAGRGGFADDDVRLRVVRVRGVVVDVGQDAGRELGEQFRPYAGRIGTVYGDRDPVRRVIIGSFDERHAFGVGDQVRGDPVAVHAQRVDALREEHAAEGGLGADAVAIGAHMAQYGHFPSFEALDEIPEGLARRLHADTHGFADEQTAVVHRWQRQKARLSPTSGERLNLPALRA